jgi:parvulin-like peptidyl-prolyl isomerase
MCRRICLSILMILLLEGCDDNKSRLTDAELERLAITQKIELVEAAGGFVLLVGGETLTSDEIIDSRTTLNGMYVSPAEYFGPIAHASELEQFKELARRQLEDIVMAKISNILLFQNAKRQAGANVDEVMEKTAENEYRKFVLNFGGDQARADNELKKRQMDKKSFMEQQKRAFLIQWYVASKLPGDRPVTYDELMECYNRIKDKYFARAAKIRFRLIDIQPAKLVLTDPNEDRIQFGKERADKLLELIKSGKDFGELAKQFSNGDWRDFGGLWRSIQPSSLAEPYDILAVEAEKIEPGQVAGPIITKGHIFIMKLEEKQVAGYEPFEQVQDRVEEEFLSERRDEVVDKLYARIRLEAKLSRTDKFIDFCLEKIYRINNTSSEISGGESRNRTITTKN